MKTELAKTGSVKQLKDPYNRKEGIFINDAEITEKGRPFNPSVKSRESRERHSIEFQSESDKDMRMQATLKGLTKEGFKPLKTRIGLFPHESDMMSSEQSKTATLHTFGHTIKSSSKIQVTRRHKKPVDIDIGVEAIGTSLSRL
jgi:hypothetical protein